LLNRCVSKGWIDKKPYGLQGHHKYIFNKASFIIWIMSLSNDSAMSLSNDSAMSLSNDSAMSLSNDSAALSNDSAMSLSNDSAALSNDSAGTIKRYCIDNLDKLKDNKEIDNQKTNVDMTIYNNNPKHHNYPNLFEFKNKTISTQKQIVNQGIEGIGFETPNEFISLCQYVVDHPMFNGNEITTALKYVKPTPIIIEIPVHEVIEESIESDKKQLKAFFN
jgi:hypothetical protein